MPGRLRGPALLAWCLFCLGLAHAQTAALAQVAPFTLGDGFWNVHGRGVSGSKCGDWFVRLASRHGQLSGMVGVWAGNSPLQNLTIAPDGSFSGSTAAGWNGSRLVRAYQVTGQFSGDSVTVTLENEVCPDRTGRASRSGHH